MHWSDICREKNAGMKCDSADACARCIEEARQRSSVGRGSVRPIASTPKAPPPHKPKR